jgi:hypothetical protein
MIISSPEETSGTLFMGPGPGTLVVSGSKPAGEWEGPAIGPVLRHIIYYVYRDRFCLLSPHALYFSFKSQRKKRKEKKELCFCLLLLAIAVCLQAALYLAASTSQITAR